MEAPDWPESTPWTDWLESTPWPIHNVTTPVRTFESGATRDTDEGKYDYEGFIAPEVWEQFAKYMHKHRVQSDGQLRASDNWRRGIPREQLMKSLLRHVMTLWLLHRKGGAYGPDEEDAWAAILFNTQAYALARLKGD